MEPVEDEEERNQATPAQQPPSGGSPGDGPSPTGKAKGSDKTDGVGGQAASAEGKTPTPDIPKMDTSKSEPKRAAARDVDPAVELGEAFEGFTSASLPKMRKQVKKNKKQKAAPDAAAFKIRLHTAAATPASTADQAKRKVKAGIPGGLSKRPIRSAFGGRGGDLVSVDMRIPALTDDEIGAAAFFGPSGAGGSFGGSYMELSDGDDDDNDEFGRLLGDAEQYAAEFENSLNFYSETHEEEDPVYAAFASAKAAERREAALARLEAEEAEEREKFEERAKAKAQKARAEVKAKIAAVRQHNLTKQQKQKEDAQAQYEEKRRHNEARVMQGQQIVGEKQKKDFEKAQLAMQQLLREGKVSREDASNRWAGYQQHLASSASRMQAELQAKAEELRKKADAQYALQQAQIQKHHEKRNKEMDVTIQRFISKYKATEEQDRRRQSRRFEEQMKKRREGVLRRFPPPKLSPPFAPEAPSVSPRSASKDIVAARGDASPASRSRSSTPSKKHHHHGSSEKRDHHHGHHRHHHHHHGHSQDVANAAYQSFFHDDDSDSVLRQKRRKNALNIQSVVLQVEVHNEGIVLMPRISSSSDSKSKGGASDAEDNGAKKYQTFVPWGFKARQILHSILCGEVPKGFGWDEIPYSGSLQAGQVRCMVTDMRTSEELASIMRTDAAKEQEGIRAKQRVAELREKVQDAQKVVSNAREEVEIAAQERSECVDKLKKEEKSQKESSEQLSIFKEKASAYFNADGSLNNVTPQDYRERLLAMLDKYRETLEGHNKSVAELKERVAETKAAESALKRALSQAKKKVEAAEHSLQRAIKKAEADKDAKPAKKSPTSNASKSAKIVTEDEEEVVAKARVGGVLDILRITADKRRSHLESKRHNNFLNYRTPWKDGGNDAEDWPDSLKRSLVMKMQRRRVQITLRPSRTSILSDVKMETEKELAPDQNSSAKENPSMFLERALRAEQMLLLSLHPAAEESPRLPSAPKTSSSSERWAEPGWKLALDISRSASTADILPSSIVAGRSNPLHETLLSECLSAPGRQTALMMQQSQLRLLCNPLSDLSRASAPAETHPAGISPGTVVTHKTNGLELDPMNVSEGDMLKGYSFVVKKRKSSSTPTSKKRTNSRGASKERKQGSGTSKKRRTNKTTSSKKTKDASQSTTGATSSTSKPRKTNAASAEKSRGPTSSSHKEAKHPNTSMQVDSLPQPPEPMQNFSPNQLGAAQNQSSRSSMAFSDSARTLASGHQRPRYQGGEVRAGNVSTFNEAQVAIPQPPPPPQQRAQQHAYQQQQRQQQQHQFYQQQQHQQMYFAAQQQAASSQQMQSPMQPQYQQMRMPAQGYSGQTYPIHQMQDRGGAVSGSGQLQPQPPPPMMGQGMNASSMSPPGAVPGQRRGPTNPNDPHFQQKN